MIYHSYVRREGRYLDPYDENSIEYQDIIEATVQGHRFDEYYTIFPRDAEIQSIVEEGRAEWLESNETVMLNTLLTRDPNEGKKRLRDSVFRTSIDKMNPLWWEELTQEQLDAVRTWRQAWLDYPNTGIRPDDSTVHDVFNISPDWTSKLEQEDN